MDTSNQVTHADLDEIEQAAKAIKSSVRAYVDALKRFLSLIDQCVGLEIPVATLQSFGHELTQVGEELTAAGNETLSRIAETSHKATQPMSQREHNAPEARSEG
jgi:hypothetical protein